MHYPTDILGGLVVGSLLLVVYKKLFPLVERFWKSAAMIFPFFLLFFGCFFSINLTWVYYVFFSALGVAVGLLVSEKIEVRRMQARAWQAVTVVLGLCLLFTAGILFPRLEILWDFTEGYWLSFLGGWLGLRFSPKLSGLFL